MLLLNLFKPRTRFRNFQATPELKKLVDEVTERIARLGPAYSHVDCWIEQRDDGYLCQVEVASRAGRFRAYGLAASTRRALNRAHYSLLRDLVWWRRCVQAVKPAFPSGH